jgi:hypothetical protein
MIEKYMKREERIEAVQYTGVNLEEIKQFVGDDFVECDTTGIRIVQWIDNRTSITKCFYYLNVSDYVVKGIHGIGVLTVKQIENYKKIEGNKSGLNVDEYSSFANQESEYVKAGTLSLGKQGVSACFDWWAVKRDYNRNIDLYVKRSDYES